MTQWEMMLSLLAAGCCLALSGCKPSQSLPEAQAYVGSSSCRECHPQAYALWAKSNHGLAERAVAPESDQAAFVPARSFQHGTQSTDVRLANGDFLIRTPGLSRAPEWHKVERVIGNEPVRQFLVAAPRGRWQALEAAYQPGSDQWFDVFGAEDRQPGEWGHWSGRGLNWNSMCAGCHNTRVEKNYEAETDSYRTTMYESSVACEACHGPLRAHVEWQRNRAQKASTGGTPSGVVKQSRGPIPPDPTLPKRDPKQLVDMCASCHARRAELTGAFRPGDDFFDHFELSTVDQSDLFYPDGQVRDEDYEYAAFLGSKMHQAGVTCLDCHPRALHMPRLSGNEVCLRCHATGNLKAPLIQPEAHSHHQAGSTGNQCAACHMPQTVYMQRHARHDHGFTIPDPLLTRTFGTPNACNRCHSDKEVEWTLAATEKWYGSRMNRPSRRRAELVAMARQGDVAAQEPLLALLKSEPNPYWRAVTVQMLDQWIGEPKVAAALESIVQDSHPLVRAKAVRALEPVVPQNPGLVAVVRGRLADISRSVRIAAAWVLRAEVDTNAVAGRELRAFLDYNQDQPAGQMMLGSFYQSRGQPDVGLMHFQKALAWDPNSLPIRQQLAVALSSRNRYREALEQLEAACRLAPKDAESHYLLALACNELGDSSRTVSELELTVKLQPQHGRGWYNLGLAQNGRGEFEAALASLAQAELHEPSNPRIPYARATILARLERIAEAKAAVERALAAQRNFEPAVQLNRLLSH